MVIAAMLFSCEKEQVDTNEDISNELAQRSDHGSANDQKEGENATKEVGDELCECTGFQLVEDAGSYSCPPPDKDCSKVQPCPCDLIADVGLETHFDKDNFDLFQEALADNTLTEFFSSKAWVGVFNGLKEKPEIHEALKSGEATVVEYMQSDKVYYFIVDEALDNADNIQVSDAMLTLEVPVAEL